jgi:hypothetical protein
MIRQPGSGLDRTGDQGRQRRTPASCKGIPADDKCVVTRERASRCLSLGSTTCLTQGDGHRDLAGFLERWRGARSAVAIEQLDRSRWLPGLQCLLRFPQDHQLVLHGRCRRYWHIVTSVLSMLCAFRYLHLGR